MRKYIKAVVQNMAKDDVMSMISNDTLERIKRTDKRPEVKVFSVAHEGTANSTEISMGTKVKKAFAYVKDMVIKINDRLQIGTPIFNRHGENNDNTNRVQIGEVVGKSIKYVGDKLSSLAAIYIYPEHKNLKLDVASFEANVEYIPKSFDKNEVIDVDKITGIALSDASVDQPAFQGATLLGVVNCFLSPETKEEKIMSRLKQLRLNIKNK